MQPLLLIAWLTTIPKSLQKLNYAQSLKQTAIIHRISYIIFFLTIFFGAFGQGQKSMVNFSTLHNKIDLKNGEILDNKGVGHISFEIKNDFGVDTAFYFRNKGNGITTLIITDSATGKKTIQQTGNYIPINHRFGNDGEGFLPLAIKKNTKAFVQVNMQGFLSGKPNMRAAIFSPEAYYKFYKDNEPLTDTHEYLMIFFLGAMFLMLSFFLFMYTTSKQQLYGIYAFYLALQLLCSFFELESNTLVGSITLRNPLLVFTLDEPLVLSAIGAYLIFTNTLLGLKTQYKRLYLFLKWLAYSLWAYSLLQWFVSYNWPTFKYRSLLNIVLHYILIVISLTIIITVAIKIKSTIKTYFIAGSGLFLAFSIMSIIRGDVGFTGYILRLSDTNWYDMGILCECFFFAFALGIRIKEMREEKDKSNAQLIEQMKLNEQLMIENNQKLEQKVLERTKQMKQQAKEMEEVKLQETRSSYERQISETRMLALRSRMNPHFLFNSLNSIKYFILKNDNDTAAFYLNKFSRLLRLILDYTSHETITLQQELDALNLYLDIESLRFDQSFHYHIHVDENVVPQNIHIPPLLLQPFVENAIWHGLANSDTTDKKCAIEIRKINGHVLIQIIDNGVGRKAAAIYKENKMNKMESYGIKITDERIDLYNQVNAGKLSVAIKDNEDLDRNPTGTTVNILMET